MAAGHLAVNFRVSDNFYVSNFFKQFRIYSYFLLRFLFHGVREDIEWGDQESKRLIVQVIVLIYKLNTAWDTL